MASKNVTKIETGSVVEVISREGKWVRVRTAGGLLGYVRQSQLEPVE
ncbi:SH3 domain-containing protein [Arenimonas metalli]